MGDAWEVAAALVAAPTLPEKLRLLLATAPRIGRADSATIYLRDDVSGAPRAIAQHGFELDVFGPPRAGGYTDRVLRTGHAQVVNDVSAEPAVNPVVPAAGVRAFVALPLFTRREAALAEGGTTEATARPIGVLFVNANRPQAFTPRSVAALEGLAALAAVAIENSYLLETQRATAEQLREALRLREQFASAASHELKTPLTPLKGYAQTIQHRLERADAGGAAVDPIWLRRALGVMLDQVDRLDGLVTDLLDVSRLRAGEFSLAPEPLDLVPVAREALDRLRDLVAAEAEDLERTETYTLRFVSAAESLPGVWDRNRIDQLFTNLLGNAVKYSPEGGPVELRVSPARDAPPEVRAEARRRALEAGEDWVHVAVRDEGIGLPDGEAQRAALFAPFSRGENAPPERFSGFGLGLYICAEIARRHGGAIWAESSGPHRGTTFHVVLPSRPPAQ